VTLWVLCDTATEVLWCLVLSDHVVLEAPIRHERGTIILVREPRHEPLDGPVG